jgi:hypothetical protein
MRYSTSDTTATALPLAVGTESALFFSERVGLLAASFEHNWLRKTRFRRRIDAKELPPSVQGH